MHWMLALVAAAGHRAIWIVIAYGAYRVLLKLPQWIAEMRVAITRDAEKAEIARAALSAVKPLWIWQRVAPETGQVNDRAIVKIAGKPDRSSLGTGKVAPQRSLLRWSRKT